MSYPKALGSAFRAFVVSNGYTYQEKPSAKRFFDAFTSGEWKRKPKKLRPVVKYKEFPGGQTAAVVSGWAYAVLSLRGRHYKTFGHLIQDILAGNWEKQPQDTSSE
ncbi:hypothetical protein [Verrucomicrobium spinosum]|uniref:hypothetical protein n=1 Tax=Verrucomicrobium spinosum TaxID=2736 RepID=UPI0001744C6E|nr:hypothetical protein [Verrucomicrobium spinosum]